MMDMKKIVFILLALLGLSIVMGGIAEAQTFYQMNVTMINYEPDPAEAGRYVTVRFKFENTGGQTAEDIIAEILPKYPFSLDPGESASKSLGSVRARQSGDTGVIVDWRLKVDENALEGDNEIDLRYRVGSYAWNKLTDFLINIQPHDIILSIESIDAPKLISPGQTSEIAINLKNLAASYVKEIKVSLNLAGVPFATIGSTNKKIIKSLDAGASTEATFNLIANPDADSGLYNVPMSVEFYDRIGTKYIKNESFGLIVGAVPDLSVNIDSSTIYSSGGTGDVTIKFVNKGVTNVKFLNAVLDDGPYDILTPKEVYVGNIDSDDYETADYKLKLDNVKGDVQLPLLVQYMDANNNPYSEKINLPLKLYSASEAKALGLKKGNSAVGIVVVIIVIVGGFFVYRWWKKKKTNKVAGGIKSQFFKNK
jgi:hypothetical protein